MLPVFVLILAACDRDRPEAGSIEHPTATAKPILTKDDLCRMVLAGNSLETQTLLDLVYEINPTHRDRYSGPDAECHRAAMKALSQSK